jgi:amino acid adenylation domain-containing protein
MTTQTPPTMSAATDDSSPVMLPASFAQELLWLMHCAAPESTAYNVPRTRRLVGPLDVDALRGALGALVARHEILRTTYATVDENVVQVVHEPGPFALTLADLGALDPARREAEARLLVAEQAQRPFDLSRDPLLRVLLVRLAENEHLLHSDSHHIAFDGWSRDVLFRELAALYEERIGGPEADLPALPIQYADYAIWEREHLSGARLERLLGYWRAQLGDADFVLQLPTDHPRPAVPGSASVTERITIEAPLLERVKALGLAHDATLYMVLLAAYATVLHRYTGQPDVLVGSPSAGRSRPETEHLIGYFANTLVQRARFAGDPTFAVLLVQLRESALGAFDHQEIPFEKLVLELQGGQRLSHSPLFQVVLTQLGVGDAEAPERLGSVELRPFGGEDSTTKFDLTLFMAERGGVLTLMLRARSDLYEPRTVRRMLGHLRSVLEAAVAAPDLPVSRLQLATAEERAELAAWNDTTADVGAPASIVELFAAQVARVPRRTAVVADGRSLTYAELNEEVERIARRLGAQGAGSGSTVGVLLDRTPEVVAAMLAVLRVGAAYVPVPPDVPAARARQQLHEAGARVVVTMERWRDRAPEGVALLSLDDTSAPDAPPASGAGSPPRPDDLAYVLFTSGSTGVPKGVAVSHANVVHYTRGIGRVLADVPRNERGDGFAAMDGWSFGMVSSIGADLGNTALFPALLAGGTLHLVPREVATDPARFAAYVGEHPLDVLKITPNHLRALVAGLDADALRAALPRRWAVLGGEALAWDFAQRLLDAGRCRVLNHYGPTETTVGVATFEVTAAGAAAAREAGAQTVPIGHPLTGARLHVLDANGQFVPVGVPGELYIAGGGVADGYLHREELTAERFVAAGGEGRAYRSGDRVRRLPDGAIEFLGRGDDQVKVRGYRVEPAEVERVLLDHPGVAQAAVLVCAGSADARLVAYVVPPAAGSDYASSHAARTTPESAIDWVASRLPDYMVPAAVIVLERMPLGANGKIDRAALPSPTDVAPAEPQRVEPATPTESAIAAIWREVLKKDAVGVTDDFISLGGHSLLAIRVLGKLSRTFGVRLPLRTLFDAPTIAQLAEIVDVELQLAAVAALTESDG